MTTFKLLVPLDGSRIAEHALVYIEPFKHVGPCEVRLLAVADESEDYRGDESTEATDREFNLLSTYLREVDADVEQHAGVEVDKKVLRGAAAAQILDEVESFKPDLLVISTHGRSGAARWRLGSVADKVIRGAACQTLVIGPNAHEKEIWIDIGGRPAFQSILVPLDGSELAERALSQAARFAAAFGAKIDLVRVVAIPVYPDTFSDGAYIPSMLDALEESATAYLKEAASKLPPELECQTHVLVGDAATQLEQYVLENDVDLVAMTSHGRTGFSRVALGSIADRMLAEGTAPVLLIRSN
jgi:nucleotide-binding universal stress UspA family protein